MSTSIVGQKYQISRRIGAGSFGEIFLGIGPNFEKVYTYRYILMNMYTVLRYSS